MASIPQDMVEEFEGLRADVVKLTVLTADLAKLQAEAMRGSPGAPPPRRPRETRSGAPQPIAATLEGLAARNPLVTVVFAAAAGLLLGYLAGPRS